MADMLHADVRAAMEEEDFNEAQQNQERMPGKVSTLPSWTCKRPRPNSKTVGRDLHDAAYRSLEDASKRITETKRKADDALDQIRAHKDRCRRATTDFVTAKEELNDCLGPFGAAHKGHRGGHPRAVMRRPRSSLQ